jgi:hypothetical protein
MSITSFRPIQASFQAAAVLDGRIAVCVGTDDIPCLDLDKIELLIRPASESRCIPRFSKPSAP